MSNDAKSIVESVEGARIAAIENLQNERVRLTNERDKVLSDSKATIASIAEALDEIERGLASLGVKGRSRKGSRKARSRKAPSPREHNDSNLVDSIAEVLSDGPKNIKDILANVNYKSNSPNFRSSVQQAFTHHLVAFGRNGLPKMKDGMVVSRSGRKGMFVRVGRGTYAAFTDGMKLSDVEQMTSNLEASNSK